MPFGEELYNGIGARTESLKYGTNADAVRQKFTSYQKDDETGLDFAEARMYQNLHGRFTAIDPLLTSGNSADPQTFNRYVYVRNLPTVMTDKTGMLGDYYSSDGSYLGSDGEDDRKVYFARVIERRGNEVDLYKDSITPTTFEEVRRAQDRSVALTPGVDTTIPDMLSGGSQALGDASVGMRRGAANFFIGTWNVATNPGGIPGAMVGVPNPFAVDPFTYDNARQYAYGTATGAGLIGGSIFAGGALASSSATGSVVPAAETAPQLSRGAKMITDLVGAPGQATGTLNKSGDLVITGTRFKFRVDLKNPGNDAPHVHLQELINGKWRDAITGTHRIYPKP